MVQDTLKQDIRNPNTLLFLLHLTAGTGAITLCVGLDRD
jgi:hypothetical protein